MGHSIGLISTARYNISSLIGFTGESVHIGYKAHETWEGAHPIGISYASGEIIVGCFPPLCYLAVDA